MKDENWPLLKELNIRKAWEWFIKQDGISNGFSKNKLGRALNAFSYIYSSKRTEPLLLLWTMIALEAIYTKEGSVDKDGKKISRSKQLRDNSQKILGKTNKSKKIIDEMYNFRSRFIHGQKNLPYFLAEDFYNEYGSKFGSVTTFSLVMLISTFQYLIENNINDLDGFFKN